MIKSHVLYHLSYALTKARCVGGKTPWVKRCGRFL